MTRNIDVGLLRVDGERAGVHRCEAGDFGDRSVATNLVHKRRQLPCGVVEHHVGCAVEPMDVRPTC